MRWLALLVAALTAVPAQAQVTQAQAQAAAGEVATYLAGNPLWACDPARADGFNPVYYAAHNADVVAARLDMLDHWTRYGKREGRQPCEVSSVTIASARADAATLGTYASQVANGFGRDATRTDGWNARWYAHARPDVVAAGVDLLAHWTRYGRWEGTLPYEGATPWTPATATDWADAPAPQLVLPDVWVPAGATTVRVRAYLVRNVGGQARPFERSADAVVRVLPDGIAPSIHVRDQAAGFLPDTGAVKEWTLDLPARGDSYSFQLQVTDTGSNPTFGSGAATVHVGGTPPASYAYPAALAASVDPQPAIPATPTIDDDLTSLSAWRVGGFAINHMDGYFAAPGSLIMSGKPVDPVPLVTEGGVTFRRFLPQDYRRDPIVIPGGFAGWSMSAISRKIGGATGLWLVRERMYRYPGEDMATLWGIAQPNNWPPELDSNETWANSDKTDRQYVTWHLLPDGRTTGMSAYRVPEGVWLDRLVQRTARADEADGIARYRQWVRRVGDAGPWRLVYECPDFLEGVAMTTNINNEGWGGDAAGGSAPPLTAAPFDAVAAHAYFDIARVRYWAR